MTPTKGRAKQVGQNIIQTKDRELYFMARDVSLEEPVGLCVLLAFKVEVNNANPMAIIAQISIINSYEVIW